MKNYVHLESQSSRPHERRPTDAEMQILSVRGQHGPGTVREVSNEREYYRDNASIRSTMDC